MNRVITTRNTSHRAAPLDSLTSEAVEIFGSDRVRSCESLEAALKSAIAEAHSQNQSGIGNCAVLIAGSVVTAGEARAIIRSLKGGAL